MNVLLVAPELGLQNVEDWIAAAQGLSLTVLNRTVTVREALDRVASGCFEVVHFATHGDGDALQMSDGCIPCPLLEDAARAAGNIELVILGSCKSVVAGAALYAGGARRVLSWRDDVDDATAVLWARTFYASLQMQSNGVGRIWDASQTAAEVVRAAGAEPPIYLNGRLAVLEAEVQRLQQERQRLFAGAPLWLIGVLVAQGLAMLVLLSGWLR